MERGWRKKIQQGSGPAFFAATCSGNSPPPQRRRSKLAAAKAGWGTPLPARATGPRHLAPAGSRSAASLQPSRGKPKSRCQTGRCVVRRMVLRPWIPAIVVNPEHRVVAQICRAGPDIFGLTRRPVRQHHHRTRVELQQKQFQRTNRMLRINETTRDRGAPDQERPKAPGRQFGETGPWTARAAGHSANAFGTPRPANSPCARLPIDKDVLSGKKKPSMNDSSATGFCPSATTLIVIGGDSRPWCWIGFLCGFVVACAPCNGFSPAGRNVALTEYHGDDPTGVSRRTQRARSLIERGQYLARAQADCEGLPHRRRAARPFGRGGRRPFVLGRFGTL